MDMEVLRSELTTDPLSRGYAAMSDAAAATRLNVADRSVHRESMTGDEILQNVVPSEFTALSDAKRLLFMSLLGIGTVDPWGKAADVAIFCFGAGSGTIAALGSARSRTVSRAEELGLGVVYEGHVQMARR